MHIIGGNTNKIIQKTKAVVYHSGNKVSNYESFVTIGFNPKSKSADLHSACDILDIAIALEMLRQRFTSEFEELPEETQKRVQEFLEKNGGDVCEKDRSEHPRPSK